MHVSTKGRYGLRILLDVAMHEKKGPVALRDISQRQEISQKYLWQVINPLKVAGLLRATRGAHGGYVLAKSPKRISIRDIVDILEGPVCIVGCVQSPGTCERSEDCTARDAWAEIENRLKDTMDSITLQYLLEQQAKRNQSEPNYDI
ncbi:MAG: RrF2 family transcriptional regulator [Kiritimatiellia bacterium]